VSARRDDASRGIEGSEARVADPASPGGGSEERGLDRPAFEDLPGDGPRTRGRRRMDDFQPYARSKVTPVPVRDDTLHRDRLLGWLDGNLHRRVTLLIADAGYGKTTLLADYSSQHPSECLWYRLDSTDRDTTTFLTYLVAAIREQLPEFGVRTAALLGELDVLDPSRDLLVRTFFADLEGLADAPSVLILDDFHLVDTSSEIQQLMTRLLKDAPSSLHFVIASRRRPRIPLARLAARGEVAELDKAALRFTGEETGRLFAEAYGRPLQPDVLDEVDRRTEGWAASLQLLHTSVRGRTDAEVRQFVASISGAEGTLYDFLAEELLADLEPELARFLVYASALDRVLPHHVAAALSDECVISPDEVTDTITAATTAGLLMPVSATEGGHRFHPLLRDFLERQLRQTLSTPARRELHRRVADACLPEEWLARTEHLVKAGDIAEAVSVAENVLTEIVGAGIGARILQLFSGQPALTQSPALRLIAARERMRAADYRGADALLASLAPDALDPVSRAVYRQALSSMAWERGDSGGAATQLRAMLADRTTPGRLRRMSEAFLAICDPMASEQAHLVLGRFSALAQEFAAADLHHHAAVAFHNAAEAAICSGNYRDALQLGNASLREAAKAGWTQSATSDTHSALARAAGELGLFQEARRHLEEAGLEADPVTTALGDAGILALALGDTGWARTLFTRAAEAVSSRAADEATTITIGYLGELLRWDGVTTAVVAPMDGVVGAGVGATALLALVQSLAAEPGMQSRIAEQGRKAAHRGGWHHWSHRLGLVAAITGGSAAEVRAALEDCSGRLGVLELAQLVATRLPDLDGSPALQANIAEHPGRWLPILRRLLGEGPTARGRAAAHLLEEFGALEDATLLRAFEKMYLKGRKSGMAQSLLRRLGPRMTIFDLGPVSVNVGHRTIPLAVVRRKAASLLMYLVTRPSLAAAPEQAIEVLWPDSDPTAGMNSLNQALYFLRRDIDPWYEDGITPGYVRLQGDMLWLERSLVIATSRDFHDRALSILKSQSLRTDELVSLVSSYEGYFAPEFQYEEWAESWRDQVHATYLAVARLAQRNLVTEGKYLQGAAVAQAILGFDSDMLDAERDLVWLYHRAGASAAAREQYAHYAQAHRSALDAPPLSFEALTSLRELPEDDDDTDY
jgi:DNA-binding SARP family transcriptional activator